MMEHTQISTRPILPEWFDTITRIKEEGFTDPLIKLWFERLEG